MDTTTLPTIEDIRTAARRIDGVASETPLVESPSLSRILGREVYLKLECFQPIRVFKIRGAYNKISQLASKKIVAASSGNHGLAVAYSSRLLGKQSTVVIPETAVREKADAIAEYGAEVVRFGKYHSDRESKAAEICERTGAAFVHPFNDPDIIAGQGTCGLEIAEQLTDFDSVIGPVGGGGVISGISIAVKACRSGYLAWKCFDRSDAPLAVTRSDSQPCLLVRVASHVLSRIYNVLWSEAFQESYRVLNG